mmetsp:Transcript_2736/g.7408  ORF Transcript_2736/g.7408 Transcript_2736/m.7408 type:complete len:263 (-) Transcript_2736:560-1348(-)
MAVWRRGRPCQAAPLLEGWPPFLPKPASLIQPMAAAWPPLTGRGRRRGCLRRRPRASAVRAAGPMAGRASSCGWLRWQTHCGCSFRPTSAACLHASCRALRRRGCRFKPTTAQLLAVSRQVTSARPLLAAHRWLDEAAWSTWCLAPPQLRVRLAIPAAQAAGTRLRRMPALLMPVATATQSARTGAPAANQAASRTAAAKRLATTALGCWKRSCRIGEEVQEARLVHQLVLLGTGVVFAPAFSLMLAPEEHGTLVSHHFLHS